MRRAAAPRPDVLFPWLRRLVADELKPRSDQDETAGRFPRDLVRELGRSGVLGLPYPRDAGGGGWRFTDYLRVLELLATGWLTVAETVAVHTLACLPLARHGSDRLRRELLPGMLGGEQLGSYCLSEPGAGSDAAALTTRASVDGESFRVDGTKAWITHAGHADFYNVFVRTGAAGTSGISCLLVDAGTPGLTFGAPERKMGLHASPVAQVHLSGVRVPRERLIGEFGSGFTIAMSALDAGRLGIAACAVGLAQAALDIAVAHARDPDSQGIGFLLADMATAVEAGRSLYLSAAGRYDAGLPVTAQAAMAKLFCTDTAMRVTSDAVQALGDAGYTPDHPVERYLREAKVLQIFEGTNQIQRLVINRELRRARVDGHTS